MRNKEINTYNADERKYQIYWLKTVYIINSITNFDVRLPRICHSLPHNTDKLCGHSWHIFGNRTSQLHCRQRALVGIDLSSSGTSQLGMFDIQATTKSKYYGHIVLLYLESRRCRYRSIIFACFYLYITVVIFIDYSDIDKKMNINNEKC
jgi:hypothetical protein